MSAPDWTADLALYPDRPRSIDVVALLTDPHFDLAWRGDMLAGAEAIAELIEATSRVADAFRPDGNTMSRDEMRDVLRAALARATGAPA